MNIISKYTLVALMAIASATDSYGQSNKVVTTTFWVAGVCGLCEETIEKTMDTKGVVSADYNLENNQLTVIYKSKKISEDQIHKLLNEAGYDTEKSVCSEEQYSRVHACCKYREQEKH